MRDDIVINDVKQKRKGNPRRRVFLKLTGIVIIFTIFILALFQWLSHPEPIYFFTYNWDDNGYVQEAFLYDVASDKVVTRFFHYTESPYIMTGASTATDAPLIAYATTDGIARYKTIFLHNLETDERTPLVTNNNLLDDFSLHPSGDYLVYARILEEENVRRIYSLNIATNQHTILLETYRDFHNFTYYNVDYTWSDDALHVLVHQHMPHSADYQYYSEYYSYNLTSNILIDVPLQVTGRDLTIASDGTTIAYLSPYAEDNFTINIFNTAVEQSHRQIYIHSNDHVRGNIEAVEILGWQPDGAHLLLELTHAYSYVNNSGFERPHYTSLALFNIDTSLIVNLAESPQFTQGYPTWSMDGLRLIYRETELGAEVNSQLVIRDMVTREETVVPTAFSIYLPVWQN